MKQKILILIFILFMSTGLASKAFAESGTGLQQESPIQSSFDVKKYLGPGGSSVPSSTSGTAAQAPEQDIFQFIADTIDFLTAIIGSFSLLVFIVGALYMLVAEGQEDRLQKGKQAMVYALIGLAIALFAYVITTAVQSIFF